MLSMEHVDYTVSTIQADFFFCNQALDLYQDLEVSRMLHKHPKIKETRRGRKINIL